MTVLTPANAFAGIPFPGHAAAAWDPTQTSASGGSFSNGNLTVGQTPGASNNRIGRSNAAVSSGKFYFEIVVTTYNAGSGNEIGVGVLNASQTISTSNYLGIGTNSFGYYGQTGDAIYNGGVSQVWGTYGQGDNVGIAVDIGNAKVWGRVNGGNWNNTTDNPATNTGGLSITVLAATTLYSGYVLRTSTSLEAVTAQFKPSSFTYAAPSGFVPLGFITTPVQSFTYPGTVWPQATGPAVLSWLNAFPSGAVAQGRQCNGNTNYLSLLALPQLTSTISIAYWYNQIDLPGTAGGSNRESVIYRGDAGVANVNYLVLHQSPGNVQFIFTTSPASYKTLTATLNTFDTGVWHEILITSDFTLGGTAMYQDGTALSVSGSGGSPSSVGTTCKIGAGTDAGKRIALADVAIWSNQLTSGNATSLASAIRANQIGQNATLVGYWQILGQSPEPDSSGNALNANLVGPPPRLNGPLNLGAPIYFPQHGSGLTNTVQDFLYPGAVQPQFFPPAGASLVFSQQTIIIPILMTVPVTVTVM